MRRENIWQLAKSDYLKLLPILGLAFYISFIPHQNYPYPVHIDEWLHMAFTKAMLGAGDATFRNPFTGGVLALSSNLEAGFHVFWGVFQSISGISWLTIFRYFPSVVFMMTVLSVYVLARREGFGWEAAFVTCLIPTTPGILGPAFLVPVTLGLLFIPLSLFLAFNFRSIWSYLAIFIFTSFLLSIHAPTAAGSVIILIPYILLNLKGDFKHSLGIVLAVAIPFLASLPWIFDTVLPKAQALLSPQPLPAAVDIPMIIEDYGYLPIALALLGTFLLAIRGEKKNYSLILGLLALLVMLATFFTFHYGVPIVYERGLMYMMLMLSIIAGAGLMGVRTIALPAKLTDGTKSLVVRMVGSILCLVLIGVTLATTIPNHQNEDYYHMIDQQDYEAFTWVRDNVSDDYAKAILDPWKATAFTAITQKRLYTRIHAVPHSIDFKAYDFLEDGSMDTAFLRENGISVIYTRVYDWEQSSTFEYSSDNPDLVEVRRNVYLLKEAGSQ